MKPEEIKINDWQRIFIGNVPGEFYLEVILRIVIIYLVLMISMRLMGKRMASQLSRNEMIAMVSLAAAIGVPLQSPDRGILAVIVIAAIVVSIQQIVARVSAKNQRLETVTQGNMTPIIEDSHLNLKQMQRAGITRERAFAQLRGNNIRHLGEVKRLYFEAGGSFTMIKNYDTVPGLPILPIWDKEYQNEISETCNEEVCEQCGNYAKGNQADEKCSNCGNDKFIAAVK
ncbi:YetF domain-containing protein [Dyadobacter crusticola]|uniref:YetF domain-containing protein n=1 Tax=Dyadobacter crusticola TaxID=292407 RepID=UPI0004E19453|nr:YetF domain-containing protein [Dyadobacter crusticola]